MTLSTVRCQILGRAEIHTRGIRLTPESELQFGLALFFCGNPGRQVPRDDVARLFWPQSGLEAARHNLRQSLYRLRVLGVPVRSGAKSSVLETHLVEADFLPVVAEGAPASVYLRMTDVSVLPGYSPKFSRAFARWVEEFRQDIGTRIRRGLVRAISEMRARGRYSDVERLCRFCLILDPLNEEATLALAESVALAGGKAEAVGMIDRYSGEVSRYPAELHLPAQLLRERISDRLIRRSQANMELPMIGREEDVERVMGAYQRLKANRSVSYIVRGASGVGKTRLALECCRIARVQGARVLTIGTQPSSRTQALYTVSELVDDLLQLPGAIGCAPAALQCLREMSAPLGVKQPPLSMETDGEARFAMVRWSILDVLDAILSEGPLLIHVDDAHQVDAQSQLILQDALRTHADRPLLLLLTMRDPDPSDAERFARLTSVSTVHDLSPLNDESCDRLVHRFCAAHEEELDDATRDRIIQLSAGNAFFLLELLKHRSELSTDELPVSVQALLEDRLSRLSPTALTVLRAAAVLGLSSNVERLQRLVERKTSSILTAVSELHQAGMLSAHRDGTECRHDTIRDAVLERTPPAARRLLHRRAAKVLGSEAAREGGVAELWECLHHWRQAGSPEKGVSVGLLLARRLLRLGTVDDAATVLENVERECVDAKHRLHALHGLAKAARIHRDWPKLTALVTRVHELRATEGLPDRPHSVFELQAIEAHLNSPATFGLLPESVIECVRSRSASVRHRLEAARLAMTAADNSGNGQFAMQVLAAIQSVDATSQEERSNKLTALAIFHSAFGDANRVSELLSSLVSVAQENPLPVQRAIQIRRAAYGMIRCGSHSNVVALLEESLRTFRRLRLFTQAALSTELLCSAAIQDRRYDDVIVLLRDVAELGESSREHVCKMIEFAVRTELAFALENPTLLLDDQYPESELQYLQHANRVRQRLRTIQVATAILRGEHQRVMALADELLDLHSILGATGFQDFPVAVLGKALIAIGRENEARSLLTKYLASERRWPTRLPETLERTANELDIPSLGDRRSTFYDAIF